jgi:thioredoxin reductase (NADPH)
MTSRTPAASVPGPADIAVVGAGPCGLAVGIAAARAGLRCTLFDRGVVASSIGRYPADMTFFSTAERIEIGDVPFTVAGAKPTRREALRYYQRLATHFALDVRQYHDVLRAERKAAGFELLVRARSGDGFVFPARNVVIATGYFDHPNRLDVPGANLPKVSHGYHEAWPYFQQDVVVVGGGNSAVDAALELHRWNARVTLVHFADGLDKGVKPWVLPDINGRISNGDIAARWRSRVAEILPRSLRLRHEDTGASDEIPNDWVLAMTGFTPDPTLLRQLGVGIHPDSGIPFHDPATFETDVPGVFIAGVIAAGNDANKVFIENGRDHGPRIVAALIVRGSYTQLDTR